VTDSLEAVAARAGVTFDRLDALIREAGYLSDSELQTWGAALLAALVEHCRVHGPHDPGERRYVQLLALAEKFARESGLPELPRDLPAPAAPPDPDEPPDDGRPYRRDPRGAWEFWS
jgi:hypothetical protein